MKLAEITQNAAVTGIVPGIVVRVVSIDLTSADAVTVYFKGPDDQLREQMLLRSHEPDLEIADSGRPWSPITKKRTRFHSPEAAKNKDPVTENQQKHQSSPNDF